MDRDTGIGVFPCEGDTTVHITLTSGSAAIFGDW